MDFLVVFCLCVCVCVFEVTFVWELHVPFDVDVCVLYTLLLFGNPIATQTDGFIRAVSQ